MPMGYPLSSVQVASGSYTGDGTNGRNITCGFVPKIVIIECTTAAAQRLYVILNAVGGFDMRTAPSISYSTDQKLDASNGFIVNGAGPNINTNTYNWVAIA